MVCRFEIKFGLVEVSLELRVFHHVLKSQAQGGCDMRWHSRRRGDRTSDSAAGRIKIQELSVVIGFAEFEESRNVRSFRIALGQVLQDDLDLLVAQPVLLC